MMFLTGGHLACSSHQPLTSPYSPVTKRLQAGQDQGFRIVYTANIILRAFRCTDSITSSRYKGIAAQIGEAYSTMDLTILFKMGDSGSPRFNEIAIQQPKYKNALFHLR